MSVVLTEDSPALSVVTESLCSVPVVLSGVCVSPDESTVGVFVRSVVVCPAEDARPGIEVDRASPVLLVEVVSGEGESDVFVETDCGPVDAVREVVESPCGLEAAGLAVGEEGVCVEDPVLAGVEAAVHSLEVRSPLLGVDVMLPSVPVKLVSDAPAVDVGVGVGVGVDGSDDDDADVAAAGAQSWGASSKSQVTSISQGGSPSHRICPRAEGLRNERLAGRQQV